MIHHTDDRADFDPDYGQNPFKPMIVVGMAVLVGVLVFLFFREAAGTNKQFGFNTNPLPMAPITAPAPAPRINQAPSFAPPPAPSTAPRQQ